MAGTAVWATAAGVAVWTWLGNRSWWFVAGGWMLGILTRYPAAMIGGLLMGLGMSGYVAALDRERRRDRDEQEALLFVERLSQLVRVRGTLSAALDDMGYRASGDGGLAEQALDAVARKLQVRALTFVSQVALLIRRHGGRLEPLLTWASDAIQQAQAQRLARKVEAEARRSTVLVLVSAPVALCGVFRLFVPAFYRTLGHTAIGNIALLTIGITSAGVLLVMAHHAQREADVR